MVILSYYFRSEDMKLYELVMQSENSWTAINEIAKLDCVHFIDLNKGKLGHEQLFAKIVKTIDETEHKLK